jgi:predicted glycogen debranching enzyme
MDVNDDAGRTNLPPTAEWLEADGLGGFASGTVSGLRTRRYHALLLSATTPPTGRAVLVNGVEAWLDTPDGTVALTSQRYVPDVVSPDGSERVRSFSPEPWPRWHLELPGGRTLEHEVTVPGGFPLTVLSWTPGARKGAGVLYVRPLLSGRDMHLLHQENADFRFESALDADADGARVYWRPYPFLPEILAWSNGDYAQDPHWYRNFLYTEERARGLDCVEDLGSPGVFRFDLSRGEAVMILATVDIEAELLARRGTAAEAARRLRAAERTRRRKFASRLHRAADAYLVRRGEGRTVIAGYPWFTDWGRDTFISLRGLCLATGRLKEARDILVQWADAISEGMLPNCFPDRGDSPHYNSVDASLWYVVAVGEYLRALDAQKKKAPARDRATLAAAVEAVLDGYARGTRYGIRLDSDALLCAGEPGVQLTWMDAKVGDSLVTPRAGKPVEVQALWLNALSVGAELAKGGLKKRWQELFFRGLTSFRQRFWNKEAGCLFDVVDPDGRAGEADATFRPNQIFAAGGLPISLLETKQARRVVDAVEARLVTPLGLRTLAPGEPGYAPHYEGDLRQRDAAYHQGTAWPWLLGPFVEAWVRVRGGTAAAKQEARACFLEPLLARMDEAGLGHLPEIADAEPPHTPRGCPFQAWSVGEALRLTQVVLAESGASRDGKAAETSTKAKAKPKTTRPKRALATAKR